MTDRGFVRGRMAAVWMALVCVAAASPLSASAGEWSGAYIGFKSAYVLNPIDYVNTGTPDQNLSGAMLGVAGGVNFDMNKIVLGVTGDVVIGNLNDFVRDGNYITESGKMNFSGSLRARAGVDMGNVLPYLTAGVMLASLEQGEICPDPIAAPFGFCHTHGPFNLKQTQTLFGATVGGGVEVMIAQGWSLQGQYLHTFFPATTYLLGPDGDGHATLPASVALPNYNEASLTLIKHF